MAGFSVMVSGCLDLHWSPVDSRWILYGAWDDSTGSWPGSMKAEAISACSKHVLSKRNSIGSLLGWQDRFYSG